MSGTAGVWARICANTGPITVALTLLTGAAFVPTAQSQEEARSLPTVMHAQFDRLERFVDPLFQASEACERELNRTLHIRLGSTPPAWTVSVPDATLVDHLEMIYESYREAAPAQPPQWATDVFANLDNLNASDLEERRLIIRNITGLHRSFLTVYESNRSQIARLRHVSSAVSDLLMARTALLEKANSYPRGWPTARQISVAVSSPAPCRSPLIAATYRAERALYQREFQALAFMERFFDIVEGIDSRGPVVRERPEPSGSTDQSRVCGWADAIFGSPAAAPGVDCGDSDRRRLMPFYSVRSDELQRRSNVGQLARDVSRWILVLDRLGAEVRRSISDREHAIVEQRRRIAAPLTRLQSELDRERATLRTAQEEVEAEAAALALLRQEVEHLVATAHRHGTVLQALRERRAANQQMIQVLELNIQQAQRSVHVAAAAVVEARERFTAVVNECARETTCGGDGSPRYNDRRYKAAQDLSIASNELFQQRRNLADLRTRLVSARKDKASMARQLTALSSEIARITWLQTSLTADEGRRRPLLEARQAIIHKVEIESAIDVEFIARMTKLMN